MKLKARVILEASLGMAPRAVAQDGQDISPAARETIELRFPETGRRPGRLLPLACATLLASCTNLGHDRAWGAGAGIWPGTERLGDAAVRALGDPWTWAPLAGAAVVSLTDSDEQIAEWAHENTPLFGSPKRAQEMSNDLWSGLQTASVLSTLATPGGDDALSYLDAKGRALLVRAAASEVRSQTTSRLKRGVGRPRPDDTDDLSFPSGHTSAAFNHAAWTAMALEEMPIDEDVRTGMQWTAYAAAVVTGWARIEGGRHYPSDVLAGAALGNFTARFFQHAFLGPADPDAPQISVSSDGDTLFFGLRWSF